MQKSLLDPDVADTAPSDSILTTYDEEHLITHLRLLDAVLDHEKSAAPSASVKCSSIAGSSA